MLVRILFKNGNIEAIENVYKISNQSAKGIGIDNLLIYQRNRPTIRPIIINTYLIDCVEVAEVEHT